MVYEVSSDSLINGIVDAGKKFPEKDKDKYGRQDDQSKLNELILP